MRTLGPAASPILLALCLAGCLPGRGGGAISPYPLLDDYPAEELLFHVGKAPAATRDAVVATFAEHELRFREETRDGSVFFLTVYLEEPAEDRADRIHRTAYRVRIDPDGPGASCSWAAVTWVVQSRGVRDEAWETTPNDATYRPPSLVVLKDLFRDIPCR